MADKDTSLPVNVQNDDSGYSWDIDSSNDGHIKSKLWDGTNEVTVTNERLDVNAILEVADWDNSVRGGRAFTQLTGIITISGTNENDFLLITNPVGSGKILRVRYVNLLTPSSSAGKQNIYRFYRAPTITANGTALTIQKLLSSGGSSTSFAYKLPTISARGLQILDLVSSAYINAWVDINYTIQLIAGESLLVTVDPQTNNDEHQAQLLWEESLE